MRSYICTVVIISYRFWCPCNILFSVGGSSGDGDNSITVVMIIVVALMVIYAI